MPNHLFVRVSTEAGLTNMPAAIAARDSSLKVVDRPTSDAPKPRVKKGAATPSPKPEATVSADTPKESA